MNQIATFNPPYLFDVVEPGVYRSGNPTVENFPFLCSLSLSSLLFLSPGELSSTVSTLGASGVNIIHKPLTVNQEPFACIFDQKQESYVLNLLCLTSTLIA